MLIIGTSMASYLSEFPYKTGNCLTANLSLGTHFNLLPFRESISITMVLIFYTNLFSYIINK